MCSYHRSSEWLDAWTMASEQLIESAAAANRATFAAFGMPVETDDGDTPPEGGQGQTGAAISTAGDGDATVTDDTATGDDESTTAEDGTATAARADQSARDSLEPDETLPDWEFTSTADSWATLGVGDRFSFTKTLTDADVRRFALASGDSNPLHLDESVAADTRFEGRVVHGTLAGGLISATLARMPGLVVYLSQEFSFQRPVRVGDRLTTDCEVVEELGNNQYRLTTRVCRDDEVVIDGEAVVLVDEMPDTESATSSRRSP